MTIRVPDPVIQPEHAEMLLRAAGLAPSLHNSQPWQFAVGARHVEVYADPSNQLRDADPSGRSLLISCGAAVFNLRVAFARLGYGVHRAWCPTKPTPPWSPPSTSTSGNGAPSWAGSTKHCSPAEPTGAPSRTAACRLRSPPL